MMSAGYGEQSTSHAPQTTDLSICEKWPVLSPMLGKSSTSRSKALKATSTTSPRFRNSFECTAVPATSNPAGAQVQGSTWNLLRRINISLAPPSPGPHARPQLGRCIRRFTPARARRPSSPREAVAPSSQARSSPPTQDTPGHHLSRTYTRCAAQSFHGPQRTAGLCGEERYGLGKAPAAIRLATARRRRLPTMRSDPRIFAACPQFFEAECLT